MLIYLAERDAVVSIAGLGPWPKATDPAYFFETCGGAIPLGLRRTVVPAAPDAWIRVLKQFGTLSFAEVAAPAIRHARDGFTVHPMMARFIARYRDQYASFPENAKRLKPTASHPPREICWCKAIWPTRYLYGRRGKRAAAGGADRVTALEVARRAFYEGDIAQTIVAYHANHDGWLSREDLAAYRTPVESPLAIDFHGATVYSCRPWCQGPSLLQMLRILDGIDLPALGHNSADYVHTLAETIKLAFADRERYYGDPDVIDVPIERLLAADYGAARRALIDPARAFPGLPPAGEIAGFGGVPFSPRPDPAAVEVAPDTSYVATIDTAGNVCSITPSDVSFESPVIPGLGFCPGARRAILRPARPRRLHGAGQTPAVDAQSGDGRVPGRLAMPFGAPGGDTQPQGMLQVLLNHLVFGMNIQEAIEAPRFSTHSQPNSFEPHDAKPGRLALEAGIEAAAGDSLAARGHDLEWLPSGVTRSPVSVRSAPISRPVLSRAAPIRAVRAARWDGDRTEPLKEAIKRRPPCTSPQSTRFTISIRRPPITSTPWR